MQLRRDGETRTSVTLTGRTEPREFVDFTTGKLRDSTCLIVHLKWRQSYQLRSRERSPSFLRKIWASSCAEQIKERTLKLCEQLIEQCLPQRGRRQWTIQWCPSDNHGRPQRDGYLQCIMASRTFRMTVSTGLRNILIYQLSIHLELTFIVNFYCFYI